MMDAVHTSVMTAVRRFKGDLGLLVVNGDEITKVCSAFCPL